MSITSRVKSQILLTFCLVTVSMLTSCKKSPTTDSEVNQSSRSSELVSATHTKVNFNNQVMPILSDKCFHCHGPDAKNQESDYRLDTEEHAKKLLSGGGFGIVAGSLEKSEIHHRIHTTGDGMMPPADSNRSLTDGERHILDSWIKQGAKYTKHWSYKSVPKNIKVPEKTEWTINEIDQFIQAKFPEHKLSPAAAVSKEKWLRRVTFDLTGLPPTIAELDAFIDDDSADAYDKAVDKLFLTEAYAERMTNEWMDVARYADSYGYQTDKARFVWPWRDWVISSFKKNQRYSEFMTWQLAGDLLPNPTREQILATTFNRLHSQKVEGGSVEEEFRVEYVSDRLHTFGTAFLGLTMECSKCHDHKYDPLSTKSYYEMSSFFANVDEAGLYSFFNQSAVPPPTLALTTPKQESDIASKLAKLNIAEKKLAETKTSEQQKFKQWLASRPTSPLWKNKLAHISFNKLEKGKFANTVNSKIVAKHNVANKVVEGKELNAISLTGDNPVEITLPQKNREIPLSFSFWIKPTKLHERAVIFHQSRAWTDSASKGYELLLEEGKLSAAWIHFWPGNALRVKSKSPLPVDKWSHITITYDGSSRAEGLKIYTNGKLAPSNTIRDHLTKEIVISGGKLLKIGQRFRDSGFKNGQLDEFQIFERSLSAVEAQHLFDKKSLTNLLAKPTSDLTEIESKKLFQYYLSNHSKLYLAALTKLKSARAVYNAAGDKVTEIMVMKEMRKPKKAYILGRGLYSNRTQEVTANTPSFLPSFPEGMKKNRLGLTTWLLADENPLTSRVTVNRYWQMIFSRGIVSTPEDFGSQGSRPTHADLLDWLARDFMDNGWNLRRLLKQMVLSATYRQSTVTTAALREIDPTNLYLSRGNPTRLSAEMIRDQALSVSGLLDRKVGGKSVKPYEVAYSLKPMNPDTKQGLYRRSLYTWWQITAPAPVMTTFNASKRAVCRVSRDVTASPLQALILLNGVEFVEASRALGAKMLRQFPKAEDQQTMVETLFRTLTSRYPETTEKEIFLILYQEQLAHFKKHPSEASALLKVGKTPAPKDIDQASQAAATMLANTISNLDECLLKR